jgi:hypothetical protein
MKKIILIVILFLILCNYLFAQFVIPNDAILIESNQLKSNGKAYIIEQRWRLKTGDIMYAYYDAEGTNEAITQRIEKSPILAIGADIKVDAMPGIREFKFEDRRLLVQFMKMMGLLIGSNYSYDKNYYEPNVSLKQLETTTTNYLFTLSLDLYDQSWSLLKEVYYSSSNKSVLSNENYDVKRKYN